MARTQGATNIVLFEDRTQIETSSSGEIRHLANPTASPLKQFEKLLKHQRNFLKWIDTRHDDLREAKKELSKLKGDPKKGPKDDVYRKYKWYAEQLTLLEAINNLEVFYKQTLIRLASALQEFIPPENIKGTVDGRVLWSMTEEVSPAALLFQPQLFHDLDKVDQATAMLINKRRYNVNDVNSPLKDRSKAIHAVFQIRHTLSHNGGLVTESDGTKLQVYGYDASINEIIDPTAKDLGRAILRLLETEAEDFTEWLRKYTIEYLQRATQRNLQVPESKRTHLQELLGTDREWDKIQWSS